jgi:hypothetical protein
MNHRLNLAHIRRYDFQTGLKTEMDDNRNCSNRRINDLSEKLSNLLKSSNDGLNQLSSVVLSESKMLRSLVSLFYNLFLVERTLVKADLGQSRPWSKRTLVKADLGQSGPWSKRTLVKADLGQSGPWSKQTLVKADLGPSRPWSKRTLVKADLGQSGLLLKRTLVGGQNVEQKGGWSLVDYY